MIISKENNILLLQLNQNSIQDADAFCTAYLEDAAEHDVIFDVLAVESLNVHIEALTTIVNTFHQDGCSAVIVALPQQYDAVSDALVFVPTLDEAHDFIELERIQRDLGF